MNDILTLVCLSGMFVACLFQIVITLKTPKEVPEKKPRDKRSIEKVSLGQKETGPSSWKERLQKGLSRSSAHLLKNLEVVFSSKAALGQENLDYIEEILYSSDIGPKHVQKIIDNISREFKDRAFLESDFKKIVFDYLDSQMHPIQSKVKDFLKTKTNNHSVDGEGPIVVMIVGVNGAGKTTTIGKLATKLTSSGMSVVVGACDTFRAAAVEQLELWCQRAGASCEKALPGQDPASVAYKTIKRAIEEKADYCLIDTAGRLHTKESLMRELEKTRNVVQKLIPSAPHHILLVIDAITGQNAMNQAREFHKTLGLTGLVFTKCDGSSKAGNAISIVSELEVPINYIGVGEGVDDLMAFDLNEYLHGLLETRT